MLASAAPAANYVPLFILGWVIAAFRRKLPIGGWLFYFFWGVFTGLGIAILNAYDQRAYALPGKWASHTRYLMYMLSWWPRVGSLLFVGAASVVLIRRQDWQSVETLRSALIAYLICNLATVAIDSFFFPSFLVTNTA